LVHRLVGFRVRVDACALDWRHDQQQVGAWHRHRYYRPATHTHTHTQRRNRLPVWAFSSGWIRKLSLQTCHTHTQRIRLPVWAFISGWIRKLSLQTCHTHTHPCLLWPCPLTFQCRPCTVLSWTKWRLPDAGKTAGWRSHSPQCRLHRHLALKQDGQAIITTHYFEDSIGTVKISTFQMWTFNL
jgi:hypothetical protein